MVDLRTLYYPSPTGKGPVMAVCPVHKDDTPSLAIYADHAHCFGCGLHVGGGEFARRFPAGSLQATYQSRGAERRRKEGTGYIPVSLALTYHRWLMERREKLAYLEDRGFTRRTIEELRFGYAFNAYAIPIFDGGKLLQIRFRRDDDEDDTGPKYFGIGGTNETTLYLRSNLDERGGNVWLCEGEFDAAIVHQDGLCALSPTNGAGSFLSGHAELLRGRTVLVAFDQDDAGDRGAARVAAAFKGSPSRLYRVVWDPALGGDITELRSRTGRYWTRYVKLAALG